MKLIKAQENIGREVFDSEIVLFVAGGITDCEDWQAEFINKLKHLPNNVVVLNPRADNFNVHDPKMSADQIHWEYLGLKSATHIVFWFPKETLCPITLFEYGKVLGKRELYKEQIKAVKKMAKSLGIDVPDKFRFNPEIFVGCDPGYKRIFDVNWQTAMLGEQGTLNIHNDLDNLANDFIRSISDQINRFNEMIDSLRRMRL